MNLLESSSKNHQTKKNSFTLAYCFLKIKKFLSTAVSNEWYNKLTTGRRKALAVAKRKDPLENKHLGLTFSREFIFAKKSFAYQNSLVW